MRGKSGESGGAGGAGGAGANDQDRPRRLSTRERAQFDALVERTIRSLPASIGELLEQIPVIVEDFPDASILRDLGMDLGQASELCGLHTGTSNTEQSLEHPDLPSQIMLFRLGILEEARGWVADATEGDAPEGQGWEMEAWQSGAGQESVLEQIRITLLHEIGHQFGLDEDDLGRLGYE